MKGRKVEQRMGRRNERGSAKAPRAAKTGLLQQKRSGGRRKKASEDIGPRHELLVEPGDLPASYGVTRVILLPLEPHLVHVYWEISPGDMKKLRRLIATHSQAPEPILRFYDITHVMYAGENVHGSFDISIDLKAGNWYVHLWSAEKSYFVELGLRTSDGRFLPIARSNTAEVPSARPFPYSDERYMLVTGDYDLVKTLPSGTEKRQPKGLPSSLPPETKHTVIPPSPTPNRVESPLKKKVRKPDLTEMSERNLTFGTSSESSVPVPRADDPAGS